MKELRVLGTGCPSCRKLAELAEQAAAELGVEFRLEKVSDIDEILAHGVMMTPALVVDDEVKVAGRVPPLAEIKEMIGI